MVAVDEAHCIPEWLAFCVLLAVCELFLLLFRGSDFRVTFSELGGLRALVDVPFMALTASAPPQVQNDILNSLHMVNPVQCSQRRQQILLIFKFAQTSS